MACAEIIVDACDSHPNGGDANNEHTPVGGVYEPDGVVVAVEATGLVQDVSDDPSDQQNCYNRPVHDVRRRHTTRRPLMTCKLNDITRIMSSDFNTLDMRIRWASFRPTPKAPFIHRSSFCNIR